MPVENWQGRNDRRTKGRDCGVAGSAKLKWLTVGGRPDGEALGGRIRVMDRKTGRPWVIDTAQSTKREEKECGILWLNGDFENFKRILK